MGWDIPAFAHIPLILGPDGAKLSKRHGALGVEAYRDMGYLPEALCNYLLRLGWGHGDEEIIPVEQAIAWFDLDAVGRSPSRLDFDKLDNLNGHYLRQADDQRLLDRLAPFIAEAAGTAPDADGMAHPAGGLKVRARTLKAATRRLLCRRRPLAMDEGGEALTGAPGRCYSGCCRLTGVAAGLGRSSAVRAAQPSAKLGNVAAFAHQLTGSSVSPGIFEVMEILGRDEALDRIRDAAMQV
jgi:glutamyl-tRNA synthetase